MTDHGYLALVLHAHLPYVRHPEYPEFLEEDWLYEAITETYLPLLAVFDRLTGDAVPWALTLTLTPPLCAMLRDPLLGERYLRHLDRSLVLAEKELLRVRGWGRAEDTAHFYRERLRDCRTQYLERWNRDLIAAFRSFQDAGNLEIITCAATHGLLPLMENIPQAVRAQIFIARDDYRECFGRDPAGIWLPECAYVGGIDQVLQEANIRWFILDAHGLMYGQPRPRRAIYAPCYTPAGPAAFSRDRESSRQVWSAQHGYPGDPAYRDFYRDIGFELSPEELEPMIGAGQPRKFTGFKYHRITGRGQPDKEHYHRVWAMAAADAHAAHFMNERRGQIESLRNVLDVDPIVVAPFDAELFGHWWFEGPEWLELFIRKAVYDQQTFELTTPGRYVTGHPTLQMVAPSASSWGQNGYWEVWLHASNSWIYPHLQTAARRMVEAARAEVKGGGFLERAAEKLHADEALRDRMLRQMARELLLAQSSDWAFLMKTGTATHYAAKRTRDHVCVSRGFMSNGKVARWTWSSSPTANGATRFSPIWTGDIMFSAAQVFGGRTRSRPSGGHYHLCHPEWSESASAVEGPRPRSNLCPWLHAGQKEGGRGPMPCASCLAMLVPWRRSFDCARGLAPLRMTENNVGAFLWILLLTTMLAWPMQGQGQDNRKVPISFLPPPLETATYSLGIYDAKSSKLACRLKEAAAQSAFTVGLNGFITEWDGKDDAGNPVPPGRYAARGYAVGALKVKGDQILGNDWTDDDESLRIRRVQTITVLPDDTGLGLLAEMVAGPVQAVCYDREGKLLSHKPGDAPVTRADPPGRSSGKNGTVWKIEDGALTQSSSDGERLRALTPKPGEPIPVSVAASPNDDRLYLLEEMPGWQRVRGLSWVETKEEDGKPVSTWQTFFERNIHPSDLPLGSLKPAVPVQINLMENPLDPGKPQQIKLAASFDDKGSYLTTVDGLRLRRISERGHLRSASLVWSKGLGAMTFTQYDGAAIDEFSIEGAKNIMAFDAGEIDMTANGEKAHSEKATEPPDL